MSPVFLGVSLKMYFDHRRTVGWADEVSARCAQAGIVGVVDVVVMPSFPSLESVARIGNPRGVKVGAQNLHWAAHGPYTGEVSGISLKQVGCEYVVVGHAERRASAGECDDVVARKVRAALTAGLVPVLCVGEQEVMKPGHAAERTVSQLEAATSSLNAEERQRSLVIAYEPVWAIGRADPAPSAHVRTVAAALRRWADNSWGATTRVAYGGSAGPGLLRELGDTVDGLFLGRYAHDPEAFGRILDEALEFGAVRYGKCG